MWNNVEALRTDAQRLRVIAEAVGRAAIDARGAANTGWVSLAANQYKSRVDSLAQDFNRHSQTITEAARAMDDYANAVQAIIDDIEKVAQAIHKTADEVLRIIGTGVKDICQALGDLAGDGIDFLEDAAKSAWNHLTFTL